MSETLARTNIKMMINDHGLRVRWPAKFINIIKQTVDRCYSGRPYHNLNHIDSCLRYFSSSDRYQDIELFLAILFHDAIYEPMFHDSEKRSAELVEYCINTCFGTELAQLTEEQILRINNLIRATAHPDIEPKLDSEALIRDIDLAILSAPWNVYEKYCEGVAKEYSFLPLDMYCHGRVEFLGKLLKRKNLYFTKQFKDLEPIAYNQIGLEIKQLELEVMRDNVNRSRKQNVHEWNGILTKN